MPRIALPLFVLLLSVAGCATMPPPPYAGPAPGGACNAAAVAWAIGRAPTPDVVERARVESGSALVRVVAPGEMVTQEFRAERLTIRTNERGAIIALACG